jgi:hypothetical protein
MKNLTPIILNFSSKKMFSFWLKKIRRWWQIPLCLCLLLLLLQSGTPVQAQAGLESRVARLESDLFGLKQQISQLGVRSRYPSQAGGTTPPSQPPTSSRPQYSSDPMFDRLATLVVELKERLNSVESRLSKLEATVTQ